MNTIPHPVSKEQQDAEKRARKAQTAKQHQEWLKAHETGQMYFQLYRCGVCGYESSHDDVIKHLKDMGCRL